MSTEVMPFSVSVGCQLCCSHGRAAHHLFRECSLSCFGDVCTLYSFARKSDFLLLRSASFYVHFLDAHLVDLMPSRVAFKDHSKRMRRMFTIVFRHISCAVDSFARKSDFLLLRSASFYVHFFDANLVDLVPSCVAFKDHSKRMGRMFTMVFRHISCAED